MGNKRLKYLMEWKSLMPMQAEPCGFDRALLPGSDGRGPEWAPEQSCVGEMHCCEVQANLGEESVQSKQLC